MAPARACLCVLCGLPAAGKSRLAQEMRGHAHRLGWMTLLVTYDELIPARDWRENEWKQHRKTVLMCLERFLHQTLSHTLSDQTDTHTLSDQTDTHTLSDQTDTHTLSDQTHTLTLSDHTHTLSDQTQTHTLSNQTDTHTLCDQTHTLTLSDQTHTLTLSDHTHTLSDQTQTHTLSDQTHTHTLSTQTHTLSDQTDTHTLCDQTHTHTLSESDDDVWMRFQQMLQQQSGSHTHTHTHSRPLVLLLDDNFYYQSMRQQVQQLARKYAMGFCQVFLHCPLQVCVRRNQQRAQRVPEEVLLQVCERMEPPDQNRNRWEQQSLTLDTTDRIAHGDLQRLMELLESALENPLRPVQDESQQKEVDRRICASSALHQADRTCRRLVSQAVASAREARASPHELKALVSELNELKTLVLQDLKRDPESSEQKLLLFESRTRQALTRHIPDL